MTGVQTCALPIYKGYATEAVGELVCYAFETLKVNRIEAYVTPGNEGSTRVLLKNEK